MGIKDGRTPRSGRLEVVRTTGGGAEPVREEKEMEVDQGGRGGDDQAAGVHQAEDEEEDVCFNDNMEDEDVSGGSRGG